MRGSEHELLLNTEIWGQSTQHATSTSEESQCAAQSNNSLSWHLVTVCPVSVIAIGGEYFVYWN